MRLYTCLWSSPRRERERGTISFESSSSTSTSCRKAVTASSKGRSDFFLIGCVLPTYEWRTHAILYRRNGATWPERVNRRTCEEYFRSAMYSSYIGPICHRSWPQDRSLSLLSLSVDRFLASLSFPWFELRFSTFQVFGTERACEEKMRPAVFDMFGLIFLRQSVFKVQYWPYCITGVDCKCKQTRFLV